MSKGTPKMRVMLIDDDQDNLKLLEECLKLNNHKPVLFREGSEAIEYFTPGCVDIVVTDINMPGIDGIEVLKRLRMIEPEIVVIMLTGFADTENSISALNNGAYTMLQKPVKMSDFLNILGQAESYIRHREEVRNKAKGYDQASEDLDKTFQELQSHVVALDQVQSVIGKIHQSIGLDSILNEILAHLTHLLNCEHGIVSFTSENRHYSRSHTRSDLPHSIRCNLTSEQFELVPKREWLDHSTAWIENEPGSETRKALEIYGIEVKNMLVAPLIQDGKPMGILAGFNKSSGFTDHDKFMVNMVGSIAVMAIFNNGLIDQLKQLFQSTIASLVKTIDAKDSYTCGHTARVSEYTQLIGRELGWSRVELEQAYTGTQFHDIGKIGIPDHVLNKQGKLTDEEYQLMKGHVNIGYEILKDIPQLEPMLDFVLCHHERWDGRGYPRGLSGETIPLAGRVVCVADSYDAMRSNRSYRNALSKEQALGELERGAGTQFDTQIVDIFFRLVEAGKVDKVSQTFRRSEVSCKAS
jgi:response regulator RpfG family c-di-GMP phosphodiesterase